MKVISAGSELIASPNTVPPGQLVLYSQAQFEAVDQVNFRGTALMARAIGASGASLYVAGQIVPITIG